MKENCSETDFKKIDVLSKKDQELLTLRCNIIGNMSYICERHENKFLKLFELHQKKCCDPFRKHKKTITSKSFKLKSFLLFHSVVNNGSNYIKNISV